MLLGVWELVLRECGLLEGRVGGVEADDVADENLGGGGRGMGGRGAGPGQGEGKGMGARPTPSRVHHGLL